MSLSYIIKQKLYAQLIEHSDHGLFILDDQFRYVSVDAKFTTLSGLSQEQIIGKHIAIRDLKKLSIETKILVQEIINSLVTKNVSQGQIDLDIDKNKTVKLNFKIFGIHVSGQIYYAGFFDENEKSGSSNEIVNHDPVTNLPSRKYFLIQFSDLLIETMQELVLVRINFDRFRILRSSYSIEAVEQLTREFVQRVYDINLQNLMLFSRFDNDDFALVFETQDAQFIRNELDKLIQVSESPYIIDNNTIYLHFSAGVSQYPKDGNQVDILLENADRALQYTKDKGGDDVCWFTEKLTAVSAEKLKLETELRLALTQEQFFPVYQPKIDLATGNISGFEALVRWNHPTKGIKTPGYFLDALLEHKLSFDLFCFMAERVVSDLYKWQQKGYPQELCINADSYDFLHPQFVKFMQELLVRFPIKKGSLHVEVTETSIMQQYDVDVIGQFRKLKDLGVKIALDDFGTGYASISYLKHYPFDYIKIDKSFVDDVEEVNTQIHIVRAIIDLANALKMYTVAEGIETQTQAKLMYRMGCVVGQGYYFGKPMPYEDATDLVQNVITDSNYLSKKEDEANAKKINDIKKTEALAKSNADHATSQNSKNIVLDNSDSNIITEVDIDLESGITIEDDVDLDSLVNEHNTGSADANKVEPSHNAADNTHNNKNTPFTDSKLKPSLVDINIEDIINTLTDNPETNQKHTDNNNDTNQNQSHDADKDKARPLSKGVITKATIGKDKKSSHTAISTSVAKTEISETFYLSTPAERSNRLSPKATNVKNDAFDALEYLIKDI